MKNIFLTGERQVGKSTLINKLLEDTRLQNIKICGFKTLPEYKGKSRIFYLESLNQELNTEKNYICRITDNNQIKGVTETFDGYGVNVLDDCIANSPNLILMDELGTFENSAFSFQEMVYKCLDSNIPVIGVLKAKSSPFLDKIKLRNDVKVYDINKNNRDEEYYKVINNVINVISK